MNERSTRAIAYAQAGIAVIPTCSPLHHESFGAGHLRGCRSVGKQALFPWKQFATTPPSHELLEQWWSKKPYANIAGLTGRVSGVVTLDQDGKKGRDSLRRFRIPRTPTVESHRGLRYLFAAPSDPLRSRISILPGVDIQAEGAYGLLPPSIHKSGSVYAWVTPLTAGCAPCPEWLLELTCEFPSPSKGVQPYTDLLRGVLEGHRNSAATRLAGHLIAKGLSLDETLEFLRAWNLRNAPPLPESELVQTCRSIGRRESHSRRRDHLSLYATEYINVLSHSAVALYESLRAVEQHRGYAPGSRLFVSYRELAGASGYSLGTISAALRSLYSHGLIEWKRGVPGAHSSTASEIRLVLPMASVRFP